MNTRQIHIFFIFSKVIQQFVWLFMCFVRVVSLKLFLFWFAFLQNNFMVANLTKLVNQHCWFRRFARSVNMKLFFKRANQNEKNFRFTTLTKHLNNQTNCCITLEKRWRKYGSVLYLFSCNRKPLKGKGFASIEPPNLGKIAVLPVLHTAAPLTSCRLATRN